MIAINSTLLLQVINFFIAYLIIRFLILRPVLAVLNEEKQVREDIVAKLATTKQEVAAVEQERQALLMRYRNYFASHLPTFIRKNKAGEAPSIKPVIITQQEVELQATKIVATLIEKGER